MNMVNNSIDDALVNAIGDLFTNILKLASDETVSDEEVGRRIREALDNATTKVNRMFS